MTDDPSDPAFVADPADASRRGLRYKCTSCGNLTRFDVTTTRRTQAFHHYSVGGELQIEDEVVLAETVEAVACRWCGTGAGVITVADGEADAEPALDPDGVAR